MIQTFRMVSRFRVLQSVVLMTVLAGIASLYAQQTQEPSAPQPQQQQPDNQQSSSQEAPPEETTKQRKAHAYKKWTFNVGGGASLTNGTTRTFVRGGGGIGA